MQGGTEQHPFCQSYVLPKSHSVEPDPEARRNGYLLLTEEFRFRQFLVRVAFIIWLTVHSIVLGIHFRYLAWS